MQPYNPHNLEAGGLLFKIWALALSEVPAIPAQLFCFGFAIQTGDQSQTAFGEKSQACDHWTPPVQQQLLLSWQVGGVGSAEERGEYLAIGCSACPLSKKENCREHMSQRISETVGFQDALKEPVAKAWLSPNYHQCESRISLKEIVLTLLWSKSYNTECPYC